MYIGRRSNLEQIVKVQCDGFKRIFFSEVEYNIYNYVFICVCLPDSKN